MIEVVIRDGEFAIYKWQPEGFKIQAISSTEFEVSEKSLDFRFNRNEAGKVNGFLHRRDQCNSATAVKIK